MPVSLQGRGPGLGKPEGQNLVIVPSAAAHHITSDGRESLWCAGPGVLLQMRRFWRGISASAPQRASDHALLAQLSDFIIAQAELGEHFLAVFPQMWWRTAVADRGLREFDRVADDGDFARLAIRIAHYNPHAPVQHLWVGEDP